MMPPSDSTAAASPKARFSGGYAAAHVEHATDIAVARNHFTDALLVHQLELVVAEAFPQALLRLQVAHLLAGEGGEHATVFQVALDVVFGHALTNDAPAFEGHVAQQLCLLGADGAFDDVNVAAVAVDDLAAVAADAPKPTLAASTMLTLKPFSSRNRALDRPV